MARRISWWKLVAMIVLAGVAVRVVACGGCAGRAAAPDERLAGHLRRLCTIAEDGIADPRTGVSRLMRYHGDHGPDMLADLGATLVVIERIGDDAAHDQRARVARDRLQAPLVACAATWQRFGEAVERDPEASAALERGLTRLGRTLEILFGGDGRAALAGPGAWPRVWRDLLGRSPGRARARD